ncbi:MAG: DUF2997 domain-containing protein [Desulfamplus sp.]|nr:DUF2997 domain-containing protein [Desulfamplus sp.]
MKQIIIEIDEEGEVQIETRGFNGKECIEESNFIKELLGHETSQKLIPAYYVKNKQTVKQYLQLCG